MFYNSYIEVYPHLIFKVFENSEINDYNGISDLLLNSTDLFYYHGLNDLIKINDNKIGYSACSYDKKILKIAIISFFDEDTKIYIK